VKTIILIIEAAVGFALLAAKNAVAASTSGADTATARAPLVAGLTLERFYMG
jgi:hypothetical protein